MKSKIKIKYDKKNWKGRQETVEKNFDLAWELKICWTLRTRIETQNTSTL